ncbi:(Fe-S)-binding protein [Methylomagnum ishizawai]|uniref:(Fe-S)-binding protein n=1 Tax=Methylomagnum ishizawai TaxID=1760988 RepID=UPI001C322ADC|nr:(Fe-S)-binding protein [Methylomagnum ishizawai]BBL73322.1 glycolate oxidase iron-sulfur subunit [Methylomagnum ishizawai]
MNRPDLAADTDLCVKCGLCLPHCPTYLQTQDENESPRGRLSLIQGWARGALAATPELVRHVDNCLLCRACEAACPAYVPYGGIVDRFRGEVGELGKSSAAKLKTAALRKLLVGGGVRHRAESLMAGALGGAVLRGGGFLLEAAGLGEVAAGLPASAGATDWSGVHPASGPAETGRADLFLGCTANLLDAETVSATLRLLNRLGVRVRVPEAQACCGALHGHGGDARTAAALMERNLAAFDGEDAIVGFASGCGAMLRDYRERAATEAAARFAGRVRDIGEFLAGLPWPDDLALLPLEAKAVVHAPCTLKNVLKADRHAAVLLRRIPGLEVVPLPAQVRCCGAAGSYSLEHPEMAGALRDEVLDRVAAERPAFLATSNPGCAMHLRAGLKRRGLGGVEVLHPVALLARCLPG